MMAHRHFAPQALLVDAGLLECEAHDGVLLEAHEHDAVHVSVERVMAMLVLTAVHDVMKLEELCPV